MEFVVKQCLKKSLFEINEIRSTIIRESDYIFHPDVKKERELVIDIHEVESKLAEAHLLLKNFMYSEERMNEEEPCEEVTSDHNVMAKEFKGNKVLLKSVFKISDARWRIMYQLYAMPKACLEKEEYSRNYLFGICDTLLFARDLLEFVAEDTCEDEDDTGIIETV